MEEAASSQVSVTAFSHNQDPQRTSDEPFKSVFMSSRASGAPSPVSHQVRGIDRPDARSKIPTRTPLCTAAS
jgi:hypothetical protein